MTPFITEDNKLHKIEHFDTGDNKLRPYYELVASEVESPISNISQIIEVQSPPSGTSTIYALCDYGDYPAIIQWVEDEWVIYQAFVTTKTSFKRVLAYYHGNFYGLANGKLFEIVSGTVTESKAVISYTNSAKFVVHSKDDLLYIPVDNILYSFDGTTLSAALLTLEEDFIITSINEYGNYLFIVGYNSETGKGVGYLWDRDSSLATVTEKYDFGYEEPVHSENLGGRLIVVSNGVETAGHASLIVREVIGSNSSIIKKYRFGSIILNNTNSYKSGDKLYFGASYTTVKEGGGSNFCVMSINQSGLLEIEQNVNVVENEINAVAKINGLFYIATASEQYNSDNSLLYRTTSAVETTEIRSSKLSQNLDLRGVIVDTDALSQYGTLVVKARKDEETAWTTIGTLNTDNSVKDSLVNNGIVSTGKKWQIRIESTGGAIINAFEVHFDEINSELL